MTDETLGVEVARGRVLREWIDINDHMNVAYYVLAFDQGVDALWQRFGLTDEYIERHHSSTFAVESHVTWQREIGEGDSYVLTSQILAYDRKRIHQFMRMYHATERYLCATAEWMNLHVDMRVRRVAPWPGDILDNIRDYVRAQGDWPWPSEACLRMRVPDPIYATAHRELGEP